jgi:hypothetical protein
LLLLYEQQQSIAHSLPQTMPEADANKKKVQALLPV